MPAPAIDRVRLVTSGDIKLSQTWSFGVTYTPATVITPTQGDLDTWLGNASANQLSTLWIAGVKALISGQTRATKLDAYYYNAGQNVARLHSQVPFGTPQVGTGQPVLPPQACLCCTLLTAVPSRRTRGRFYFPATAPGLAVDHLVPTANVDIYANALGAHLNAVQASITLAAAQLVLVVESQAGGICTAATALRVDNEIDIQRRRADKLVGSYQKIVNV